MADAAAVLKPADRFAVGMQHVAVAVIRCLLDIMVAVATSVCIDV